MILEQSMAWLGTVRNGMGGCTVHYIPGRKVAALRIGVGGEILRLGGYMCGRNEEMSSPTHVGEFIDTLSRSKDVLL